MRTNTKSDKTGPVIKNTAGVYREWLQFERYKHYDADLEAAIIGICYLEKDSFARVRHFLVPEFFYMAFHQSVWKALCEMFDQGLPIDILTLLNYMAHHKDEYILGMENTGQSWQVELAQLSNQVCQSAHLEYWAILVREQFIERELLRLTTNGIGQARATEELFKMQQKITDLLEYRSDPDDWQHISTILIKLYQWMAEVAGKDIIGVPTGFDQLDTITGGLVCGLYYLGARPSVGKTALALKWIMNQINQEIPVGIISLEMPGIQLAARALSMCSGTEFWKIFRNKMSEEQYDRVRKTYAAALSEKPLYVSDKPAVSLPEIRAKAVKAVKHGCKIIYLDYIQLVEPEKGAGNREQEVAKLSRGLKLISMQLGIPMIALAQLSRESEKRQDKTPRLIDMRESGSIEQDADGVMLLHRPEKVGIMQNADGSSTKGQAELHLAKWRNGETFTHPLRFIGDRMEFVEDDIVIEEKKGWQPDFRQPDNIPPGFIPPNMYIYERGDDEDPF